MPIEWLIEISGRTKAEVQFAVKKACEEGEVIYIYTHLGKTFVKREFANKLEKFKDFLKPKCEGKVKIDGRRMSGNYEKIKTKLVKRLPIDGLDVVVARKVEDLIEYDHRVYNFRIDNPYILDLILRNAFS